MDLNTIFIKAQPSQNQKSESNTAIGLSRLIDYTVTTVLNRHSRLFVRFLQATIIVKVFHRKWNVGK